MPRLKGPVVTVLWMAVPVAAGLVLLQAEERNAGSAVLTGLLSRAQGALAAVAADTAATDAAVPASAPVEAPARTTAADLSFLSPAPGRRPAAPSPDPAPNCRTEDAGGIAIGDSVVIRFFETVETSVTGDGPTHFERRDLAASVQVGRDGTIALPALGRTSVFGKQPSCLERELAHAAADTLGFDGRTNVTFASRPAALVRGAVLRPGSYAYDPALTPVRLVTLAGHPDGAERIGAGERGLQTARREDLLMTRAGLILRAARMRATLDGTTELDIPDAAQQDIARTLGPRATRAETDILLSDNAALTERRRYAAERDRLAEARIVRLEASLAATEAELDNVRAHRDRLSAMLETGSITSNRLDDVIRSVLSLERDRIDRSNALDDAREDAAAARRADGVADAALRRDQLQVLRDTELELQRLGARIEGLDASLAAAQGNEVPLRFSLERLTPDGIVRRTIGSETALMPGDLITVAEDRSAGPTQ